ncbi:MAG: protein FdrA [Actinomycetota bacterium]
MTARLLRVRPEHYVDSVLLMTATRTMLGGPGVEWATAVVGTPANLETLAGEGFEGGDLHGAGANDLVFAVRAGSKAEGEAALDAGGAVLSERASGVRREERRPGSLEEAVAAIPGANVALVSVPGTYAAMEAHRALSAGLHVLLFSDNVPVEAEVELKARALNLGLLMMGPGAGTAVLGGVGLGFANAVRRGPVGVIAAAGTGAQEVMSLLDRWRTGVSHVIGVGGRDLSEPVGGCMTRQAVRALVDDPATEILLLVSKPPSPAVAASLLQELGTKPVVVALLGLEGDLPAGSEVRVERTLEAAALATLDGLGLPPPDLTAGLEGAVTGAMARLSSERAAVRGLFSGGTLCYEAMVMLSARLGPVYSNTPLREGWGLPAPPGAHVCWDMGEEEYTRGRPHPMIDPEARSEEILRQGTDPATAVVLVDVVLGYGSHPDPASVLAPACAKVVGSADGPAVVVYVLGTEHDPQGLDAKRRRLEDAGCIVAPTAARAALVAGAIASRRPELVRERS